MKKNGHGNGSKDKPADKEKRPRQSRGISPKHKRFADEYLKDLNATQAYIRAGYSVKNADVAATAAARLFRNVRVRNYITQRQAQLEERTRITQERVLAEFAKIGFANIRDYLSFGPDGVTLKDSTTELTEEQLAAVAEVSEREHGQVKFKLWDKANALEKLGKRLGMFKDEVHLTGQITVPQSFTIGGKTVEF